MTEPAGTTDGRPRCGWGDNARPGLPRVPRRRSGASRSATSATCSSCSILEGAQAGLSWSTILRKRDGYRRGLRRLRPGGRRGLRRRGRRAPARGRGDRAQPGEGRRGHRQRAGDPRAAGGGPTLVDHLWSFVGGTPRRQPRRRASGEIPSETDESRAMSEDLRARGFRFVGPTICYALMQSAGLVNDHVVTLLPLGGGPGRRLSRGGAVSCDARQASRSFIRPPVWSTAPA